MPTQIPPQRGFHPSGNRPGLVTHHGDDGLTAHLRERPGPSGKQAQSCIKYGGEKENMFYLLARTKGKGRQECGLDCTLKPEADMLFEKKKKAQEFRSGQLSSLN